MKKVLLGTAVLLALLTGCIEENKPVVQSEVAQDISKDEVLSIQEESSDEMKDDETLTIEKTLEELNQDPDEEEVIKDEQIEEEIIKEDSK